MHLLSKSPYGVRINTKLLCTVVFRYGYTFWGWETRKLKRSWENLDQLVHDKMTFRPRAFPSPLSLSGCTRVRVRTRVYLWIKPGFPNGASKKPKGKTYTQCTVMNQGIWNRQKILPRGIRSPLKPFGTHTWCPWNNKLTCRITSHLRKWTSENSQKQLTSDFYTQTLLVLKLLDIKCLSYLKKE